MKKVIFTLLIVAVVTLTANAQQTDANTKREHNADERANRNTAWAEKELGLTTDQKARWEAATREKINANEPLQKQLKGSTTPEERKNVRQQIKANDDKFNVAVSTFLTADQKAKYNTMRQERRNKRQNKLTKAQTN